MYNMLTGRDEGLPFTGGAMVSKTGIRSETVLYALCVM